MLAVPLVGMTHSAFGASVYWDTNDSAAGSSGSTTAPGTWDATSLNWSTSSAGTAAAAAWVSGNTAYFSAGSNATGAYTINVVGTQDVGRLSFDEGTVTLTGGAIKLGTNGILLGVQTGVTTSPTISSVITGTSGLNLARNLTNGTLTITNPANDFTGGVKVNLGTTLKLGAAGVIPASNVVTIISGTVNLNNISTTFAGLASGSGSSTVSLGSATLTLNTVAGASNSFYGNDITGTGGVTVTGGGTQILSTNYSYTGKTTINGGTLKIDSLRDAGTTSSIGKATAAASNLVLNGGTLLWAGPTTVVTTSGQSTNRGFTIGANGGTIDGSGVANAARTLSGAVTFSGAIANSATSGTQTLTLTGSNGGTLSGVIPNGAGGTTAITKKGAGTWILSGANTYTGVTAVNAGTLVLASSAWTPALASSDITGGTLVFDYTGTSSPLATIGASIAGGTIADSAGGTSRSIAAIDDGASLVTLQVAYYGDLNLDGKVDADDLARMDLGAASGLAGWTNGDLNYDNTIDAVDYFLMDSNYIVSGVPHDAIDTLLANREAQFGEAYVQQLLTSVPEPSSIAGLLAALPFLSRRRRSR